MRIKIDKITSGEEADFFREQNHVEFLTVKIAMENNLTNERTLSLSDAKNLKTKLRKNQKFGLYIDDVFDEEYIKFACKEKCFEFISVNSFFLNSYPDAKLKDFFEFLIRKNIFIFQHAISANYDEDRSWLLSKIQRGKYFGIKFHQIEIYNEITDAWSDLSSNTRDDELGISDLVSVLTDFSLFYSLDFKPDNIVDIIRCIKNPNISFTLSDENDMSSTIHLHTYANVVRCLMKLSS